MESIEEINAKANESKAFKNNTLEHGLTFKPKEEESNQEDFQETKEYDGNKRIKSNIKANKASIIKSPTTPKDSRVKIKAPANKKTVVVKKLSANSTITHSPVTPTISAKLNNLKYEKVEEILKSKHIIYTYITSFIFNS